MSGNEMRVEDFRTFSKFVVERADLKTIDYGTKDIAPKLEDAFLAFIPNAADRVKSYEAMADLLGRMIDDVKDYRGPQWVQRMKIWKNTFSLVADKMGALNYFPERNQLSVLSREEFAKVLSKVPPFDLGNQPYFEKCQEFVQEMEERWKGPLGSADRKQETRFN